MAADEPRVGQIVEHYFLWGGENSAGQSEAAKSRPCLIVAVEPSATGSQVTVLPITTRPPGSGITAMQIPANISQRIGLDPARSSWLILDEANVFSWPGFDLVPQRGGAFARGTVTAGFFRQVVDAVLALRRRNRTQTISRDG